LKDRKDKKDKKGITSQAKMVIPFSIPTCKTQQEKTAHPKAAMESLRSSK